MKGTGIVAFNGLRNTSRVERFDSGDLEAAINVDLDDTKHLSRRGGFTSKASGSSHSIWSNGEICLFVAGGVLKRMHRDYSVETLRSGLTDIPMAYESVAGTVYYTNGLESGIIQNGAPRTWGMTPPALPAAAVTTGYLSAGTYQYALTFVRLDGQESGASIAGVIELPDDSGIAFSAIPSNDEAAYKILYLSAPNGEKLYVALTTTDTTATVTSQRLGMALTTQYLQPPPAGHMLDEYNGSLFVASGNAIYRSEPYRHELFDYRKVMVLDSRVTLLAPMAGGIFVASENETAFVSGDPFNYVVRAEHGAIPGTLTYVDGAFVGDGVSGLVAMWSSSAGTCIGTDDGSFKNLTGKRFRYGTALAGAGIYRQTSTLNQYLVTLTD